jgi:hypothetical protein
MAPLFDSMDWSDEEDNLHVNCKAKWPPIALTIFLNHQCMYTLVHDIRSTIEIPRSRLAVTERKICPEITHDSPVVGANSSGALAHMVQLLPCPPRWIPYGRL